MTTALEQEYNFYNSHRDEFAKTHLNEFVLIKGEKVIAFLDSYEKALRDGLARFGNVPFFIEEVRREEKAYFFYHGIA